MDSFEINKVLGAVLGTCLFLVAVHIASGAIFTQPAPAKPGYEIAVKEEQPAGAQGAAAAAEPPIETMMATASIEHGAQIAKQCLTCHNVQEGQGNKVGPDLYDIMGRAVASVPGFGYSAALKAKGGTWDIDTLDKWLANPQAYVSGTAMTFAGIKNEKQRADVIDYLNSLSANPKPLPTAPAASAAPPAAAPAAAAAKPEPPSAAAPAAKPQ